MFLLDVLSTLLNSNTSVLFWNLFTGLNFVNELNIKLSLSLKNLNTHSATIPLWPHIYSATSWSQDTLFTLCHCHETIFITQSHSWLLQACFTSCLEPAFYIIQNSASELFIPLSLTFIWTCQSNFLHSAINFHHFLTVSLWAQNLPSQKILYLHLSLFLSVGLISWL